MAAIAWQQSARRSESLPGPTESGILPVAGVNVLADWCERGLKIVVITQQIELNGAVGRMIAALLLGLAEIELEYRAERQAAGIEVAKRKGIYKGHKRGTTKAEPARAMQLRQRG
jgi:DNA invertase Pin-like site-specific DNA recombinase